MKKGFTLIELLAVIFLLLIILMISTPSIKRMIDDSNRLSEGSIIEKLVDAAKEYTTLYNKNLLNGLVVVGDKKNISVNNLANVGLIKEDDLSLLKPNAFVVIELKENSELEYRIEYNEGLIEDSTPYINLLGGTTYYLLQGKPFVDPGWIAFDSNGNNITNKVVVTGNDFDVNVIGMNVITYTVTDNDTTVSVTRNVIVVDSTYPTVTVAIETSNNIYNNKRAKNGDTVTLNLTFSKEVTDPKVTIGGRVATVTGSGNTRTATYTIPSDEKTLLDGELKIKVSDYQDKYFNNGIEATNVTTGGLVVYDKIIPSVITTSIVSNNSNNKFAKNGNTLTLSITFSEPIISTTVTIGGRTATVTGSGNTRTATYTIPTGEASITEGNVAISISGYRDETGNFGNTFTNITTGGNVVYDRTPPSCTSSGGNTAWRNTNLTLTGTCSDTLSGCVGNVTKTYSTEINSTTESPGVIYDNAGNSTTCPANQTVRIDKTAPTCVTSGGNTDWVTTNVTITGTCSDSGGSGCTTSTKTYTYSSNTNTTTAGPDGSNDYRFTDNAGNQSAVCPKNQTVKIDKTAPTCTITGTTTLTITATDAESKIIGILKPGASEYTSFDSISPASTTRSITSAGTYTATVMNGVGLTGTCSITIPESAFDTTPPSITFSANPVYIAKTSSIALSTLATITDTGSGVNTSATTIKKGSTSVSNTNQLTVGSNTITYTAYDNAGNSRSANLVVFIYTKPEYTTGGCNSIVSPYETGKKIYEGANPCNYVRFNNELWRIVSIETDGTYKIIRRDVISGTRKYDAGGDAKWAGSDLQVYLNGDYWNSLTATARGQVQSKAWNVGIYTAGASTNVTISQAITSEKATTWTGNVGGIQASDYLVSGTHADCGNYNKANNSPYNCKNNNWLYDSAHEYYTITSYSTNRMRYVNTTGALSLNPTTNLYYARPAVYLKASLGFTGTGTSADPYVIVEGLSAISPATCTINVSNSSVWETSKTLTISVTLNGATLASSPYSWDGVNWTSSNTKTISSAGNYMVTIKDSLGRTNTCSKSISSRTEYQKQDCTKKVYGSWTYTDYSCVDSAKTPSKSTAEANGYIVYYSCTFVNYMSPCVANLYFCDKYNRTLSCSTWGDWSAWGTTVYESSSTRKVNTRTTYK